MSRDRGVSQARSMEKLDRLLTAQELADYLEVPVTTLYHWRQHREGPPAFRVGKHLRYRMSDVDEWICRQLEESDQAQFGLR